MPILFYNYDEYTKNYLSAKAKQKFLQFVCLLTHTFV